MEEKRIREDLRAWILARSGAPAERLSRDDMPILDEGLLSSLDVVEFILFIESLRDAEVDVEAIEPEVFTSIDTLIAAFFADGASGARP